MPMSETYTTPAARVVAKFPSKAFVARVCGLSRSRPRDWDTVPAEHHEKLIAAARAEGIDLEPWEFSMLPDAARRLGLIANTEAAA